MNSTVERNHTAYLYLGINLDPYHPALNQKIIANLADSDAVLPTPIDGQARTATGELLVDIPPELPPNGIIFEPFGPFAGDNEEDGIILVENLTHPEIAGINVALITYFEGRDDSGDKENGKARGRNSLALLHSRVDGLKGRFQGRNLAEVVLWSPHSFESVKKFAELTNRASHELPISLTAVNQFAETLVENNTQIDVVVSPDRSAYTKNLFLASNLRELRENDGIPLYFFEKKRSPDGVEIKTLHQILPDGKCIPVETDVLQGLNVASADDSSDTSETFVQNVNTQMGQYGIQSLHFHFDTPILSKNGPERIQKLLDEHEGRVRVYTTDILPRSYLITDPNNPGELHPYLTVFSVAKVLAATMGLMSGENRLDDVALVKKYLLPFVPSKRAVLEAEKEGRVPWLSEEEIQVIRDSQLEQLQTVFQYSTEKITQPA